MLFEVEDETRDFVTIYKQDFLGRKTAKLNEIRPVPPFPLPLNALNGPYRKCLNTRQQNSTLTEQQRSEDPHNFLSSVREKHYWLKKAFPETLPDENLIECKEQETGKSLYRLDYCDAPWIKIRRKKKEPIALPEGWVIPETIQKCSYRNPWKIAGEALLRVERMYKPPDNLTPNAKEREILRVRTGDSEYNGRIDTTAYRVMKGCPLGVPLPMRFHSDYEDKPERTESPTNLALPARVL